MRGIPPLPLCTSARTHPPDLRLSAESAGDSFLRLCGFARNSSYTLQDAKAQRVTKFSSSAALRPCGFARTHPPDLRLSAESAGDSFLRLCEKFLLCPSAPLREPIPLICGYLRNLREVPFCGSAALREIPPILSPGR